MDGAPAITLMAFQFRSPTIVMIYQAEISPRFLQMWILHSERVISPSASRTISVAWIKMCDLLAAFCALHSRQYPFPSACTDHLVESRCKISTPLRESSNGNCAIGLRDR